MEEKTPEERRGEFDKILQLHENRIYQLEVEVQDKDKRLIDYQRELVELKNRNSKLQEQLNKKTKQIEELLREEKK